MFGWFFRLFKVQQFKSQIKLAFGLIRAFMESIAACLEEAITSTESHYLNIIGSYNRYFVLNNSLDECYYYKDEFDKVKKLSTPLISPAQESRLHFLNKLFYISIGVFFIVETILFYMIAENITGGMVKQIEDLGRDYAGLATAFKFIASALFALLSALMLDAGLRQLFYFFKAKKHYQDKFIDIAQYRAAIVKLVIGITLLVGSFLVLLLMNWARSYAIDATGSEGSSHNPILVYALVALSVFAGIAFGLVKKELGENSEILNLSKRWHSIRKSMENAHDSLSKQSAKFHNVLSLVELKSLSLGYDLQWIFEREYDARDMELLKEFRNELKAGNFHQTTDGKMAEQINVKDSYYYNNLTTNEPLLHRNHFRSNDRITFITKDIDRMLREVKENEDKRFNKQLTLTLNANKDAVQENKQKNHIPQLSQTNTNENQLQLKPNNKPSLNGSLIHQ